MTRDACALVEECHHLGAQAHVKWLLAQRIGHRVVVAVAFHVVINLDSGALPRGLCIGRGGHGPESRAVERRQQLLAGAGEFLAGAGLQRGAEGGDGGRHLHQREEGGVPKPGKNPALHDLAPDLPLGLISWLGSARRDDGKAIMLCEGRLGAMALGFIAVRTAHGRREVVGDNNLGDPTEGRKGPHM